MSAELRSTTAPTRSAWTVALLVTGLLLALLAVSQHRIPGFADGDSYFHVRFVSLWGELGLSRSFEWTAFSLWADRFSDKDLTFHLLLAPFVVVGGEVGAKVAMVLIGGAVFGLLATFGVRWGLRGAMLWAILALGLGWHEVNRVLPVRSHVLAMLILCLWVEALLSKRTRWLGVWTFLQTWNHMSAPTYPVYAMLAVLAVRLPAGRWDWKPLLWTAGGFVAGSIVNPYFPHNLSNWWLAGVIVENQMSGGEALPAEIFGSEMGQIGGRMFLGSHLVPYAWLLLMALVAGALRVELSERTRVVSVLGAATLVLGLVSARFMHEMAVPVAFMQGAFLTHDALADGTLSAFVRRRLGRLVVGVLVAVSLGPALARTASEVTSLAGHRTLHVYETGVSALRQEVPAGERVFHTDPGAFNALYYFDPDHRYLVALDPIYFFAVDRPRFGHWLRLHAGGDPDPVTTIRDGFEARTVFLRRSRPPDMRLAQQLADDPRATRVYADAYCEIFRIQGPG